MSLLYEIEKLSYNLTDNVNWDMITNIEVNPKEMKQVIDYFITHLTPNHQLPGKDYNTLCGIGDWIREYGFLTDRQKQYSILALASYWDQLDLVY